MLPVAIVALAFAAQPFPPTRCSSPDGQVRIDVAWPGFESAPSWTVLLVGKPILDGNRLSLTIAGQGDLMEGASVTNVSESSHREKIPVLFGKSSSARNDYNECRATVRNWSGDQSTVVFRCYNNAVAVRYEVPAQDGTTTVTDEATTFRPVGDPTVHVQYLENFRTSHEHKVDTSPYSQLRQDTLIDAPVTFEWPDGTVASVTEAALRHYAGMSLMKKGGSLVSQLAPKPDGTKVVRKGAIKTPWRVVLLGKGLGSLLESNTIYCLNEPNAIGDTRWIKPGKMTWPWWNGNLYGPSKTGPILSLPVVEKYIDFCAQNGILYNSVVADETDTPWYTQPNKGLFPGPGTDVTKPRDDLDLSAIKAYADQKGVRLWTWVHQAALRGRVDEAFAAFENLGWNGMMVDFFDHDDQDTVELVEQILQAAARHHVLIHFHGIWKPTGLSRTYPNLMNQEGVLNLEYLKWRMVCTPEHDLNIAFTRLVAGPMDYHLGGFRAVSKDEYKPHNVGPNVLGTRCHMLAMYVCYDNPNPMVADYPEAYTDQPGFDFVKQVPTWWDETRVLKAEYGKLLVTARRKGKTWYVGALAAGALQQVVVPTSFLGSGTYKVQSWSDAILPGSGPNEIQLNEYTLAAGKMLHFRTVEDGGYVAVLTPAQK